MRKIVFLIVWSFLLILIGRWGGDFLGLRTFFASRLSRSQRLAWQVNIDLNREWRFWRELRKFYHEKIALEEEVGLVEGQLAQQKEELRLCAFKVKQLNFFPQDDSSQIFARVIGREGDFYLRLNRGSKDKVAEGDLVLYLNNFVGTITKVETDSSLVQLLISPKTLLTAVDQTSPERSKGLVRGNFGLTLVMENLLPAAKIGKGDLVISYFEVSERLEEIPFLVGKVDSLELGPDGLIREAYIRSQVDILNLEEVFIWRKGNK